MSPAEWAGEPTKEEKYIAASQKYAAFFRAFDKNQIFLPEKICGQIELFFQGMRKRIIDFGSYLQMAEHLQEHTQAEKYQAWMTAADYFEKEVPAARKALESELRGMLGG
ncbi:MAG TPA: hypothetical protein VF450_02700 [Noviherbaspirillum sp.]